MGAGVLPIAIHNGKIYFLFSREYIHAKTDGGLWSDFGGKKDNNESFMKTAIRECHEESSGFLGPKKKIYKLVKYAIDNITLGKYRTYIVIIKYDKLLPKKFRDNFLYIKKNNPELISKKGLYEKDMLMWLSFDKLEKNIHIFRPWYKKFIKHIINSM
jgi:hypothetical protein